MGSFAASTYMRGIDFINIPTTLLAQVDANVGGKTGFDFAGIKNPIGTFKQPAGVIIDTNTLASLPKREYISGFAEIIKHGIIHDASYFEKVTCRDPLQYSPSDLVDIIAGSVEIKKYFVEADETENNVRKVLNFGHTVGHAVEAIRLNSPEPLLHGEAVAVGMAAETRLSALMGLISASASDRIELALKNAHLPRTISAKSDQVLKKMQSDKKNERGIINFTLLTGIGCAISDQQVPENLIIKVLEELRQE
jgi:3-dehydroquinate synthase